MKISLICTVLNEESTIKNFLHSIVKQSKNPDEIVIVDGGSTDNTLNKLLAFKKEFSKKKIKTFVLLKRGNRSVGRNFAVKKASGDIILCSDAGCILDKKWVNIITEPFQDKKVDVVSGFYKPLTHSVFEKCLSVYTCVMPDRVDPENFLPSSRSVAFRKSIWEKAGGYPENLDTCEDLVFDKKLVKIGARFIFVKDAIVYWPQRKNLLKAFLQFFSYAKGDGQALYIRSTTPLLFIRYLLGTLIFSIILFLHLSIFIYTLFFLFFSYSLWSVFKNYRYINRAEAFIWLPALQYSSDIAVISGMLWGFFTGKKNRDS